MAKRQQAINKLVKWDEILKTSLPVQRSRDPTRLEDMVNQSSEPSGKYVGIDYCNGASGLIKYLETHLGVSIPWEKEYYSSITCMHIHININTHKYAYTKHVHKHIQACTKTQ